MKLLIPFVAAVAMAGQIPGGRPGGRGEGPGQRKKRDTREFSAADAMAWRPPVGPRGLPGQGQRKKRDTRDIDHKHISAPLVNALPANPINFVDQGFNVRPIVNKWKPVQNVGLVQYADNVEIVDAVEIAEKQPIKYYNGAQYNNGYNGYTGYNRYNGYNSNVGRYNTGYNTGYTTGFNAAYPTNAVYDTGYNNYRVPYMQNTYNQYKPVEKVVEKVVEKIEDIKHHIEDHREEHHDDIIREVQMPSKGNLKYFFGKPEVKETTGKYSSVTGKYYNPYKNDVKVVDKIVKEEYKRPINNGFYNTFNNYVQQPLQYFQQQVQRPVRYVQQQNDQDWFNTFLTFYALRKNSAAEEVIDLDR